MSLPVKIQRKDTLSLKRFREWIIKNIDTWFAFTQQLGLGIEMEDIILVTGYHRTKSWSNIAFSEVQSDSKVSLGIDVGPANASVFWRVSNAHIQGAVLNRGPDGEVGVTHIAKVQRLLY